MTQPAEIGIQNENVRYDLTIQIKKKSAKEAAKMSPDVASFRATESLSQLFTYRVIAAVDPDDVADFETALGREASFTIKHDEKVVRVVHGIITDVAPDGAFLQKTRARVVFVLEPRMANLRFSGGFRIFQHQDIREIVATIFKDQQIDCEWRPFPSPPIREYCTQLDESDLAFVSRLASEEGMHYFFENTEQKTTVVFTNDFRGYHEIEKGLSLSFNDTVGAVHGEHVRSIRRAQRVRTGAFEHRDYDPLPDKNKNGNVGWVETSARHETDGEETPGNSHARETRDYPGGFVEGKEGTPLAQRRLEELRSDAFVLTGAAVSLRFSAGKSFTLEGHRERGFDRKLVLTHVSLEGVVQAVSQGVPLASAGVLGGYLAKTSLTTFAATPAEVPIHPKRMRKPASRLQSARVVGQQEGDPDVDEFGRIKVQFHWDREGKSDESSSCWIRMMTPVAYGGEGFYQAHKVGSEVLVDFIDGDIDRPVVLGAVYNRLEKQPYELRKGVTKSVWKSQSIPGNKGHNEITQDNTAGKEEIYMHAQRDRRTVVLHDHHEKVGANQSVTVKANQSITVDANRSVTVGANETTNITGHRKETVGKGEEVEIVSGDEKLQVTAGNRAVTVKLADTLHSQTKKDNVDKTYELYVGKSILLWTPSGNIKLADNKISLDALDEIELKVPGVKLSLKKGGIVTLEADAKVLATVKASLLSLDPALAKLKGTAVDFNAD